ncbi:MAG: M48 family metallopeptidase [Nitrospirae bacterium]|nr:M48 family metallopeptidase [Nitrospirota bacterium]
MDKFTGILLVAYLVFQMVRYSLDFVNIRHMKKHGTKVPEGFEGYIDEALLRKTHAYAIEHNTFSLIESVFSGIITIAFLYGGMLGLYASWVSSVTASFILQGVLFFLLLSYASSLLNVPFSLYHTFRIENKYGFNTMTAKLWVTDFMKSTLISTVMTVIICACGLWIVQKSPDLWWLFVWGFFLVFSIFLMYISPYVIEPLFNRFTPLEGDGLEHKIKAMMQKTGIRISRVFRVDASKRSHHTNAYFTGIGRTKRIVLYDTLLSKMDEDEVLAVLAHEAGHWKKRHVLKMILISEVLSFAGVYIAFRILKSGILADAFGLGGSTFFAELVILGFVFGIVSFPFTPLLSAFSRRHEREADRFAVELTPRPDALATSLIKLSKDNLSNLHPHPLYAFIYYSHPPVVDRVRSIHTMAGER